MPKTAILKYLAHGKSNLREPLARQENGRAFAGLAPKNLVVRLAD